jgi:integrase
LARKWIYDFQLNNKRREMGLGSYPAVSLADAREAHREARSYVKRGIDPIQARELSRKASQRVPTFREIAKEVITEAKSRTGNAKVKYQWERHLGPAYSGPLLDRPVNEITTVDVAQLLRPVWKAKPEVARKLYPAIRRVFAQARIVLRDNHNIVFNNPAHWEDLKAMGFEATRKLTQGHFPSLPYTQMQEFISALRQREAVSALMLEMLILTGVRTGAILNADWKDFDLDKAVWHIPVKDLKDKNSRKEAFSVPLSPRVIEILESIRKVRKSGLLFPGYKGKPLSSMSMLVLMKRMSSGERKWIDPKDGRPITVHGFRATFKTWGKEKRKDNDLIETALGHVVGSSVERAYNRSDVLELRRELMTAWGAYCEPKPDNVIVFGRSPS